MRERLIIAALYVLGIMFYPLIWLAEKLGDAGGWGD